MSKKQSTSNSKNNKKTIAKKNSSTVTNVIKTIVLIGVSILCLLSVFNLTNGVLMEFIRLLLYRVFGIGAYFIPTIFMIIGIFYLFKGKFKSVNSKIVALLLFIIIVTTLLDIYLTPYIHEGAGLIDRLKYAKTLSDHEIGGGALGSLFGYLLLKLVGVAGSYIVLVMFSMICIVLGFHNRISKKYMYFIENKSNKIVNKKDIKHKTNMQDIKSKSKHSKAKKEIKILDYKKSDEKESKVNLNANENSDKKGNTPQQILDISQYRYPKLEFLSNPDSNEEFDNSKKLEEAKKLENILDSFGIETNVNQISIGPTITRYELEIAPGVKINKITNLSANIALGLASTDIRIEAPIPGKAAVGIEVPNDERRPVVFKEVLDTDEFRNIKTKLPFAIGKDISGKPVVVNLEKMPHLLIAGATGSGKSVCINTLIASILYKSNPEEVKFIMIDPKVVELNIYNGIPHLLIPVVTDPKKAANALNWAVKEMTDRYQKFASEGVRDFAGYNNKIEKINKLPQIIVLIDELADLMMVAPGAVEDSICRLAQMARAAGIHLIIATQRPSVDVITGTIKANIPSRIAFSVSSQTDSRTILGFGGAEKLLGRGDMLYFPVGESKPIRLQGSFIDENELNQVIDFLKNQMVDSLGTVSNELETIINNESEKTNDNSDELLLDAIKLVCISDQTSISFLQRKLKVGYARAARIMDELEERGIVTGNEGSKPRKVLIDESYLES